MLAISDRTIGSKVLSTLPLTWRSHIKHLTNRGTATWVSIKKSLRNIQAGRIIKMPASRAIAVSEKCRKSDKHRKTSEDNDNRSSYYSNSDIQCWYCARKGHTRNNCNFKKTAKKLREKKDSKKPATAATASLNESTNDSPAMMAPWGFPGDSDD